MEVIVLPKVMKRMLGFSDVAGDIVLAILVDRVHNLFQFGCGRRLEEKHSSTPYVAFGQRQSEC